ncbi:hypothetical protein BH09MYX1_BH09MYX1_03380 [soil metagenome]
MKKEPSIDPAGTTFPAPEATSEAPTLHATSPRPTPIAEDALTEPLPATASARYVFREILGVGGMGEVKLCRDEHIGREVALKVLRGSASASADQRFIREARVQGQLEHPNVVPVYDVGRDREGALFFTMKRIRGITLEDAIRPPPGAPQPYPTRRLLGAFTSVCLTVEYAHARGVLHRDLEPANIMLGEFGEVNVLDWGIAKVLDAVEPESERVDVPESGRTIAGALVGTPGYMAPEQARAEVDAIGVHSDVYALGVILYEIVTREHLHHGNNVAAILLSTVRGELPRPSDHDPSIAPEIDAICMKALALDPSARYATARQLGEAGERHLEGDRDVGLRRDIVEAHLKCSNASTSRAFALQEAFRGLALHPENVEARSMVAELLLEAPDEAPPEAEAELAVAEAAGRKTASQVATRRYLMWWAFLPLLVAAGIRSWPMVATCIALTVATTIVAFSITRGSKPSVWQGLGLLALAMGTASSASVVLGPFVVVPALATSNALIFTLFAPNRLRPLVTLAGLCAVMIPFALESVGVLAPSMVFANGNLTLVARAVTLSPGWVTLFLVAASAGIMLRTTTTVARVRDELVSARRKSFLQAWHLRHMVE